MKQHDIAKICADSLRNFVNNNHGIKLRASHAHELVAAYFGYKSRAALLADAKYPLTSLQEAQIIVMAPDAFIDQRRNELGLPPGLPDSYALGEGVYAALFSDQWWGSTFPPFRSFMGLVKFMAEERGLIESGNLYGVPRHHILNVETGNEEVKLIVKHAYKMDTGKMHVDAITTIKLPRVAGRIGYGLAHISEERGTTSMKEILVSKTSSA